MAAIPPRKIASFLPARLSGQLAVMAVLTLLWSFPLWYTAGKTGGLDWGFMQNQWEVRWQTVFEYHQWPAHNPWQGGGVPVSPSPGYLSIQALATLLFGPKAGLSVYLVFYLLLGSWGFHKLGRLLFPGDTPAALFLAIIGPASPALAFHLTAGHLNFASLMAWPAIFCYLLSSENDPLSGLKAGLLTGLAFNETPFYVTLYGGCLLAIGSAVRWFAGAPAVRRSLLRFAVQGCCVAVPLVLPVVISVLTVAVDYQRVANTPASFPFAFLLSAYFKPVTSLLGNEFYVAGMHGSWGIWEMNAFLGFGALAFWLAGLVLARPRWFHWAMLGTFLFTLGNQHWWEPMRWLMSVPPFSSLQSFNRLRLFVQLFFFVGAAWGYHRLLLGCAARTWPGRFVLLAGAAAVTEIILTSHSIVRQAHYDYLPPPVVNGLRGEFYQRAARYPLPAFFDGWPADLPLYTRANIGIVAEPAALSSQYRSGQSQVHTFGLADYTGEFVQNGRPVKPDYWSPNRMTFSRLDPKSPLTVNLNRGNPWRNLGQPLFPQDRIVEFEKPFIVQPDAQGRVDLTYVLPGQPAVFWSSLGLLGLAAAFCLYLHKWPEQS